MQNNVKNRLAIPLLFASLVSSTALAAPTNTTPPWKSYQDTGNVSDIVKSTIVAAAIGLKVDATNGQSVGQQIASPNITSGTATGTDVSQSVTTAAGGSLSRTLANRATDYVTIADYGASSSATGAENSSAISSAITQAQSANQWVNFPYSSSPYTVTGSFTNNALGYYNFSNNVFSGSGIGNPSAGEGTLNSLYTNPYLIVTGIKYELDPAGQAVPGAGSANIGWALECLPNRSNSGDKSSTERMVACAYIGADTGTSGASGTGFTTEDLNPVLNLNTSSGTGIEQDVNFNGTVKDGQFSRALFLTGGGGKGNTTNSVALDIQHSAYDGSWLPWTVGISIRNSTNQIQQYKSSASEAGFFQEAFDQSGNVLWEVDKNGYSTAAGYTTAGTVAGANITSTAGMSSMTSGGVAYTAKATNADDYVATRASSSDTGFAFRLFSETGTTLASVDKNGFATFSGITSSNNVTASKFCLDSSCTRYVYEKNSKIYLGNTTNGDTASVDDSGNMILKGTLTQSGTP